MKTQNNYVTNHLVENNGQYETHNDLDHTTQYSDNSLANFRYKAVCALDKYLRIFAIKNNANDNLDKREMIFPIIRDLEYFVLKEKTPMIFSSEALVWFAQILNTCSKFHLILQNNMLARDLVLLENLIPILPFINHHENREKKLTLKMLFKKHHFPWKSEDIVSSCFSLAHYLISSA